MIKERRRIAIVMLLVLFCSLANCTVALGYPLPQQESSRWKVRFDHYYTHKEMSRLIRQIACLYPWLVKVNCIGESFLGKDLWVLEITNRRCGEALKKPAFVVIGPHHGDEVIGANVVLYFTWYLLTNYGKDATVTHILDTKTVYVIPLVNPDGNDITLQKDIYGRFNARPMDEDFEAYWTKTTQRILTETEKSPKCDSGIQPLMITIGTGKE